VDVALGHFSISFQVLRVEMSHLLDFISNKNRERVVNFVVYGFCLSLMKDHFLHRVFVLFVLSLGCSKSE
jgi:hypothetical protein